MITPHAAVCPLGALWTVRSDTRAVATASETREAAIYAARVLLAATGGGELVVKGNDGQVVHRETVDALNSGT